MKNLVLVLLLVVCGLLITVDTNAAGDLTVMGKIGVGVANTTQAHLLVQDIVSGPRISLANEIDRVNIFQFKTGQGDHLSTIPGGYFDYYLYEESVEGLNKQLRIYGYPTGAAGIAYGSLQVIGTNANFEIKSGSSTSDILLSPGASGGVGIGTQTPQGKLDVNGPIYQRGGVLHADYVFDTDYKLESIDDHSHYMWENKHLKAIAKARGDENGQEVIEIGSHQRGILEELEKAHIYIEQLQKQLKTLEERLTKIETKDNH